MTAKLHPIRGGRPDIHEESAAAAIVREVEALMEIFSPDTPSGRALCEANLSPVVRRGFEVAPSVIRATRHVALATITYGCTVRAAIRRARGLPL